MNRFLLCAAAVVAFSTNANAAIQLIQTQQADPASGLNSWLIQAQATAGENLNTIAGFRLTGGHNVTPAFGQPTTDKGKWDAANGAGDLAWKVYDTYVLHPLVTGPTVVGFIGTMTETNDGSDPAGLALNQFGQQATEGIGNTQMTLQTDQLVLAGSATGALINVAQVVLPAGGTAPLEVRIAGLLNGNVVSQSYFGENAFIVGIPEPSTVVLGAMGLVGMIAVARRRRK